MPTTPARSGQHMLQTLNLMLVLSIVGWTGISLASFLYHIRETKPHIRHIARETAREGIEKDLLYRYWASGHGGVYVPVTEQTRPNPYLSSLRERDIITPSGRRLTLVNPAYMTRQVHELAREFDDVQGRITSLKPLRPENAPDEWERKALRELSAGQGEYGEVTDYQGEAYYRFMYPLPIEKPCLKCHAAQGYALGDMRGGISTSIPMKMFDGIEREHFRSEARHSGGIWVIGIVGIALATPFVRRRIQEREAAVLAVEASEDRLRTVVDSAPFGAHLYRLDPNGRLLFTGANAAADRILGLDHGDFAGRTIETVFPGLSGTDVPERCRRIAVTGQTEQFEQLVYQDGRLDGVFEVHAVQTAPGQIAVFFRDITERSRAEQALKDSEERYSTIVHTAREGIVSIDARQNITFVNSRMADMLGYRPGELVGRQVGFLIPSAEQEDHGRQMTLRRKGMATQFERRFLHRDGRTIRAIVSATPLLDGKNAFLGSFGMVTDITERAEMEESLAASERQLRAIFDTMQAGLVLVDTNGTITFANRRTAELFKCPIGEIIGSAYIDYVHPEERKSGDRKMRLLISGEIDSVSLERRYLAADGSDFWGYLSGRRLEDAQGNLVSLVGIIADISERKRMEDDLRRSEEKYRDLFTFNPVPMWVYEEETLAFLAVNDFAVDHYGYSREEFRTMTIRDIRAPEDIPYLDATLKRTAGQGVRKNIIGKHRKKDGTPIDVHITGHEIVYEGRKAVLIIALDITEQRRAEQALRESEERLKEAQRIGRIGNWEWIVQGDRLWWSEEVYRIFGLSLGQEITFDFFLQRIHPEDRERVHASITEAVAQARPEWQAEYRTVLPDGEVRHLFEIARTDLDEGGAVCRRHGTVQDITERKLAEEALRRSESFTRSIIEAEPECVKILGPGGILRYMNAAGMAMIEVETLDDVLGRAVHPLVVPEHRDAFIRLTNSVFRGESGMLEFEMTGVRGTRRWLETHAVPLMDGDGGVEALLGITRDVTARKLAERGLEESRAQLDLVMRTAKMGVWHWDIKKDRRTFDRQVCSLLGIDPASFTGTAAEFFTAVHPEDRDSVNAALGRTIEDGDIYEPEYRVQWHDGSVHFVSSRGTLIRDAAGHPDRVIGILWDITDRKLAEEQQRKLEEQLLQSQKIESVGRLAGGIAHDINNMLTPILGYADMLGLRIPDESPARTDLAEIVSAANRVKDMTQQLLAFARKQTLVMRPLDVNSVITRFSKILQRTLRDDITLTLNLAMSIGSTLADERQLEQVVLNLAVNAQDAMPGGGALVISTRDVVLDRYFAETRPGLLPGKYIEISITDSGVGIDEDILSRVFDPFFTTKPSGKGTGLGLATVYGIVKQHKGYVDVRSEYGRGTTFSLYLPVTEANLAVAAESSPAALCRGSETILVVEDQDEVLRIVQQLLETLGYQVLTASDGESALDVLRGNGSAPDLLLTDVIMPGSNGRDLYDRLKRSCPPLKVLYMSGYPADVISTHGVLDRGVHFLRKPFSVQDLSLKVREALDTRESSGA